MTVRCSSFPQSRASSSRPGSTSRTAPSPARPSSSTCHRAAASGRSSIDRGSTPDRWRSTSRRAAPLSTRRASTGAYAAGSSYPLSLRHSASSGTVTVPSRASPCHCGSSGTSSTKPISTWCAVLPGDDPGRGDAHVAAEPVVAVDPVVRLAVGVVRVDPRGRRVGQDRRTARSRTPRRPSPHRARGRGGVSGDARTSTTQRRQLAGPTARVTPASGRGATNCLSCARDRETARADPRRASLADCAHGQPHRDRPRRRRRHPHEVQDDEGAAPHRRTQHDRPRPAGRAGRRAAADRRRGRPPARAGRAAHPGAGARRGARGPGDPGRHRARGPDRHGGAGRGRPHDGHRDRRGRGHPAAARREPAGVRRRSTRRPSGR